MDSRTALFASRKPEWAVEKHQKALAGSAFERCACCPGTAGKIEDGKMRCSRAGAMPVLITPEQAKNCGGKSPLVAAQEPRISSVFERLRKKGSV